MQTDDGFHPRFVAIFNGQLGVYKWLFHYDSVHKDIQKQDTNGISPLYVALSTRTKLVQGCRLVRRCRQVADTFNGSFSSHDDGIMDDILMMRADFCQVDILSFDGSVAFFYKGRTVFCTASSFHQSESFAPLFVDS